MKSKQRIRFRIVQEICFLSLRVTQFPDKEVRDSAFKVLRRNAFFAHPEHEITAMLSDENKPVRDFAVDKIMPLHETLTPGHTDI